MCAQVPHGIITMVHATLAILDDPLHTTAAHSAQQQVFLRLGWPIRPKASHIALHSAGQLYACRSLQLRPCKQAHLTYCTTSSTKLKLTEIEYGPCAIDTTNSERPRHVEHARPVRTSQRYIVGQLHRVTALC